jgi:hypothetical protein
VTPQRLCRADEDSSELLGRLEQTEDRIPVTLIEKADRSPERSPIESRFALEKYVAGELSRF